MLGGLRVTVDDYAVPEAAWRQRRPRGLVELLALAPRHRLHREQVMDHLWPDLPPDAADNNLRKTLHRARRALDPDGKEPGRSLRLDGELLALAGEVTTDIATFEQAADRARLTGEPEAYRQAITLYGGDLLPEDQYEAWVAPRQTELRTDYIDLLMEWSGLLEARGELEASIAACRSALSADPLSEDTGRTLMRLYALAGRRAEAESVYEQLRDVLARELGVEVSPETLSLIEEIRARSRRGLDPALSADLWERVGDLRLVAGDVVGAADAFQAALTQSDAAIGMQAASRLHIKAASAFLGQHDATAAERHLDAAASVPLDLREAGRLEGARANWFLERADLDEAQASAERCLAMAEREGDPADLAAAWETTAIVCHFRGAWRDGLEAAIRRLDPDRDDSQFARVFDLHHCIGQYHLYGDALRPEVEEYARRMLALAESRGARRAQAFAWCLLGEALLLAGDLDEARACLERSADLHAEFGTRSGGLARQRLAETELCQGNLDAVGQSLRHAMAIATVSPMARHLWGRIYATAALEALERGNPEAAVHAVRSAYRAAARHSDCPSCGALLNPVAAEAFAALGDAEASAVHAAKAEEVAGLFDSAAWSAMASSASGSSAVAQGELDRGKAQFLDAADFYRRAGQPFWRARSLTMAATISGWDGGPLAARDRPLAQEALALFASIGARAGEARARRLLEA